MITVIDAKKTLTSSRQPAAAVLTFYTMSLCNGDLGEVSVTTRLYNLTRLVCGYKHAAYLSDLHLTAATIESGAKVTRASRG